MLTKMEENKNEEMLSHDWLQQQGILVNVVEAASHEGGREADSYSGEEMHLKLVCVLRDQGLAGACSVMKGHLSHFSSTTETLL